jgi:hypothetical protein
VPKSPPPLPEIVEKKSRDLEQLIKEALRIQSEINEHLKKLRHTGSAPKKKG